MCPIARKLANQSESPVQLLLNSLFTYHYPKKTNLTDAILKKQSFQGKKEIEQISATKNSQVIGKYLVLLQSAFSLGVEKLKCVVGVTQIRVYGPFVGDQILVRQKLTLPLFLHIPDSEARNMVVRETR